jgi:hypothetical protein
MALDFKTLQALASSPPANATSYCPECGRPWDDPVSASSPLPPTFPWRAALLGVLGVFLAITFGHRAVDLVEAGSTGCAMTQEASTETACLAPVNLGPGDGISRWASFRQSELTAGEIRRDLLATAAGVAALLLGIGALIRPRRRARSSRGPSLALAAWAVGETLGVVVSLQILALYADFVIVRLASGWTVAWWVALDLITDQVSALFDFFTGF